MRKIVGVLAILATLWGSPALAADATLNNFGAAAAANGADLVPTSQSGTPSTTLKQTLTAIATWLWSTVSGDCTASSGGAFTCFATPATVAKGGTGAGTFTAHGVMLGEGTSPLVATAAMTNGQLLVGASAADPAPQTLSQDCTLTSTGVVTCLKTNNVAFVASATTDTTNAANISSGVLALARIATGAASHAVPVDVAGTLTFKVIPDCQDSAGNHINYTQSTDAFSCGTTSSAGSVSVTAATPNVVITPSPGTSTFTVGATTPINPQTGTSYTVVTGDNTELDTLSNASAIAVTLPQAGSAGFSSGWSNCYASIGAGATTITTTTSTINGSGQTAVLQNQGACFASDGTNWDGIIGLPGNGSSAQLLIAQGNNSAAYKTMSGDATISASGALTIANNAVTNAKAAQAGANTMKGNWTSGTANESDNAMPSCSDTAGNHLNYVTSTGITCGTSSSGVTSITPGAGIASTNTGGTSAITTTGTLYLDCSYLPFYLGGLTLSNDGGTPNTIIDVAAGAACSDDNVTIMKEAAITKTTGGTWVVGTGNAGLDAGTIAASTWYHVFVIERTDTGVVDVLISTSATAPTMPTNYTKKRRIGSFKTNGSSNIITFTQRGNVFWWKVAVLDVTTAALGTSQVLETLGSVPTGVVVQPICRYSIANTGNSVILLSPDVTDVAPGTATPFTTAPGWDQLDTTLTSGDQNSTCPMITTNTSAQIGARASAASTSLDIVTQGWVD